MFHLGPSHCSHIPLPVNAVVQNFYKVSPGEGEGRVGWGRERSRMEVLLHLVLWVGRRKEGGGRRKERRKEGGGKVGGGGEGGREGWKRVF